MRNVEAYLYSRRNIVGCLLALVGLVLHFVGLLAGLEWLPITAGLYLIGVLLVPAEQGIALELGAAQDSSEVRAGLDRLIKGLKGKVADDLIARVVSIQGSILATLTTDGAAGDGADPNVYLIRQTALAYLPDAFDTYLRMPRLMAERRPIAGGQTPHDVLLGQLDLMDHRLADVADDMSRHDSDKLLANGRFLAEKFGVSGLRIDPDGGPPTALLPSVSQATPPPVRAAVPEAAPAEPGTSSGEVH